MSAAILPLPDSRGGDDDRRAAIDAAVRRALGQFADRATVNCDELAEILGCGRSSAYEAVRTGAVASLHIGRRRLVPVPGLVAALLGLDGASSNGATPIRH
jgi:hypothetical protein